MARESEVEGHSHFLGGYADWEIEKRILWVRCVSQGARAVGQQGKTMRQEALASRCSQLTVVV